MIIRKETDADIEEITEITIAAFNTLPISNHTEQFIIKALRAAGAPRCRCLQPTRAAPLRPFGNP